MPFTLAHPAIVLPLSKTKRLSFTALVAGSIVPDFEFFFQLREVENIGHHWYGILLFDLPLAIVFCFLYHNFLRNPFLENLPAFLRSRFIKYTDVDWEQFALNNKLKITASALLGIVTHLAWDGFTHYDGFFVESIPVLATSITLLQKEVPVYFLLQMIFSIGGMAAVAIVIINFRSSKISFTPVANRAYWVSAVTILFLILAVRLTCWPQYNTFWGIVMALMGSLCYSWIVSTLFFKNYLVKKVTT